MHVEIIAVPYDSGMRDTRMGAGPDALLERGLADRLRALGAVVRVHWAEPSEGVFPSEVRMALELHLSVARLVAEARQRGAFPIVLSGNCNTAVGTVSAMHATSGAVPAVCWFDAHADFNTPESTIGGFLDGMAVAMLTGKCWRQLTAQVPGYRAVPEEQVLMIGTRDVDPLEQELLDASAVRVHDTAAELGSAVAAVVVAAGTRESYLHLDLDAIDPSEGRANGFAVEGGLSRESLLAALDAIGDESVVGAMAVTAYDPDCDTTGSIAELALDAIDGLILRRLAAASPPAAWPGIA